MADLVFLLDSSGSVGYDHFRYLVNFVHDFVTALKIDEGHHRVGLMVYNDATNVIFHLNK